MFMALTLLCLSALSPARADDTGPIVIGEAFKNAPIEGRMSVQRDPEGKLGLADVAFGHASSDFVPIPRALAAGYTSDPFWVRVPVRVMGETASVLIDLRPAYLDDVDVFVPNVANPRSIADFVQVPLGDRLPFSERAAVTVSMVAPISLPAGLDGDIYIRLKTSSTVALRGELRTPTDMTSSATAQALQLGLFQGIFVLAVIANLLFWARLRDRTYLIYAGFIIIQAALSWCKSGLVPVEWMPGGATGVNYLLGVMMFASQGSGALFATAQTNSRRLFPIAHVVFLFVVGLSLVGMVMTLFGHYQVLIGPALSGGIAVCALALICNLIQLHRRVPGSLLATTAIVFQISGVLIASLMLNAQIPYVGWMDYSFEAGSIFFIVYMTMSLAERARTAEIERTLAQAEALSVARSSEQYALDLVARRTCELAAAKDQAEGALRAEHESQQEQIRFVDVISHQYRTPLAVISSSLSALRLDLAQTDDKNRDRIDRARRAIERLVEIIDINGHRSRLQGVAAIAERAPVKLGPFLETVVARARDMFAERPISLSLPPGFDDAVAELDADMIELALVNIIENADKFSPPGAPIDVSLLRQNGTLTFAVADRGIGIPAAEHDLLTHKFFRASNSGGTSGLGIGLHIVKSAATAHDGQMLVESTEGEGTTVTMSVRA